MKEGRSINAAIEVALTTGPLDRAVKRAQFAVKEVIFETLAPHIEKTTDEVYRNHLQKILEELIE